MVRLFSYANNIKVEVGWSHQSPFCHFPLVKFSIKNDILAKTIVGIIKVLKTKKKLKDHDQRLMEEKVH